MKTVVAIALLSLGGCVGGKTRDWQAISKAAAEQEATGIHYRLLNLEQGSDFINYDILVDSLVTQSEAIQFWALVAHSTECHSIACNHISIWNSRKAYYLYKQRQLDPDWRETNWSYLCEHYVGEYQVTARRLILYPLLDADYQRWGGQKRRPKENTINMR